MASSAEMYAPLKCACGGEVRLACANGCDDPELERRPPVRAIARAPNAPRGGAPVKLHGTMWRRVYQPKQCPCGATYTPTGPRQAYCTAKCTARP